jgi:hypothetical protein
MGTIDIASPVRAYDQRVRRARRVGWAVGIGAFLGGLLLNAVLKSAGSQSTVVDLLELLAQSVWAGGGPIIGYVVYSRLAKRDGLLLWLRKFRKSYGRKIRFLYPLGMACSGMLYPVTVQDPSFRSSAMFSIMRRWILIPATLILWIIGAVFLLVLVVFVFGFQAPALTVGLALLLWTGYFSWVLWKVMVRSGFVSMPDDVPQARKEARRRFQAALDGKRSPGFGVEVLKCPDEKQKDSDGKRNTNSELAVWQAVVVEALSVADVVVIEVTEMTDPLFWELTQALTRLGRERVLLAAEEGATGPARLASELCQPLTLSTGQAVTPEWVQAALFTYPTTQTLHPRRRSQQYKILAERLRRELALRIVR